MGKKKKRTGKQRKYYGFSFNIVCSAVMSRILSGEDDVSGMPVFGFFKFAGNKVFFSMKNITQGRSTVDFELHGEDADDIKNNLAAGMAYKAFLLIKRKRNGSMEGCIALSFSKNKKQAEEELYNNIASEYLERYNINSRKKVQELVNWYLERTVVQEFNF